MSRLNYFVVYSLFCCAHLRKREGFLLYLFCIVDVCVDVCCSLSIRHDVVGLSAAFNRGIFLVMFTCFFIRYFK